MDSAPDVREHESSVKRIKLDHEAAESGELCNGGHFPRFSATVSAPMDSAEAISVDCDSGYEASTLESMPASSHHTSPLPDSGDVPEENFSNLSGMFFTSTQTDQTDTSQDSIDDDNASTVSHLSDLSGLSELSGQDWKPMANGMIWIQKQMQSGVNPRKILGDMGIPDNVPEYFDDLTLWKLIINMVSEPPTRSKLRHVNTLDDVVRLVKGAQNIIVLTGAGVSVSCGIPDFRSRDGIYSRLAVDFPDLPDPQAMFDINYFTQDPRPFFKFAKDIYPGKFKPSPCHNFIKMLEKHGKLLRNYTQNIDTLEKVANIQKVIECHGSFASATCTKCGHKSSADAIRDVVLSQKIPLCEVCHQGRTSVSASNDRSDDGEPIDYRDLVSQGIMKPDIVFFGEGLPDTFHDAMAEDKTQCDLLLVIGSSLKVRPVALIPSSLPAHVPQILINREPLPHCHFDIELMGDCDVIINHLCRVLQGVWTEGVFDESVVLREASHLLPLREPSFSTDSLLDGKKDESWCEPSSAATKTAPTTTTTTTHATTCTDPSECECNNACTKCSSFIEIESNCMCHRHRSIINKQLGTDFVNSLDIKSKERHVSIDSARDSGIGDNSNFADLESKDYETSDENCGLEEGTTSSTYCGRNMFNNASTSSDHSCSNTENKTYESTDLKGYWQPKIKKSLADRLPADSFYLIKPSRYVFPGAEIFYDPDEKLDYDDTSSSSNNSDSDLESEPSNNRF